MSPEVSKTRLPERLALAREAAVARPARPGAGRPGRPRPRRSRGSGPSDAESMTRISSSSGTRPDQLAHRAPDDRPDRLLLVERRQDEADREALLLLELDEPAQVGELGVVEVRLGEPALDPGRHGRGPPRPRGPRRRGSRRASASCSNVGAADRLARLDHDRPSAWRALAIASGSAPKRCASPSPSAAGGRAPITTRSASSASRRIAVRTLAASRTQRLDAGSSTCCLTNAASARSAWARTASVIPGGTMCSTTTVASWRRASASANAQRQLGVRAAAHRHEDPLDVARRRAA